MDSLADIFLASKNKEVLKEISPIALAFIGDAVHTLYVRDKIIKGENLLLKNYHLKASKFCNARSQAKSFENILNILTEEEKDVARRARNAKLNHTAKNSDIETYKKATAYEAVIGFLYLTGNYDRIAKILKNEDNV